MPGPILIVGSLTETGRAGPGGRLPGGLRLAAATLIGFAGLGAAC